MTTTRDYLDEIEAQLVERTPAVAAATPRPRPRPRRWRLAPVLPALAAAAAIIAAVVLISTSGGSSPTSHHTQRTTAPAKAHHHVAPHHVSTPGRHRHNPTAPRVAETTQPSGPVPAGFEPQSFTAISELQWWLLGSAPCSSPPCTSIVRTDDGGRTFVGTPAPRTTQVSQLRFADARDGFAYDPELWVTHDAGAHWRQIGLAGNVVDVEAGGGYVYAIDQFPNGTGQLLRSPVGGDRWTTLYGAGNTEDRGLWVYGRDVLVESSGAARQSLMISHDNGATFARHAVPPSVVCSFEEKPGAIWAPCATGMMSGVWRSTDGGAHFTGVGGDAAPSGPQEPNSAPFGAASATIAVYGEQHLYRTTDGGSHWEPVGPAGAGTWLYIGFTDATHGVAIGQFAEVNRLYYTTDAGASYHPVPIR